MQAQQLTAGSPPPENEIYVTRVLGKDFAAEINVLRWVANEIVSPMGGLRKPF